MNTRRLLLQERNAYSGSVHVSPRDAEIFAIERPHPNLWKYYLLGSLIVPPLFPFLALAGWFRYSTLRYRFTDEGVSMRWGVLFRREIIIHYARIQDIHLRSNMVERWLGLARVLVQTASGNAGAEMTLEGLTQFEAVRDFLYARMRGVKESAVDTPPPVPAAAVGQPDAFAETLLAIADELRRTRELLAARGGAENRTGSDHV